VENPVKLIVLLGLSVLQRFSNSAEKSFFFFSFFKSNTFHKLLQTIQIFLQALKTSTKSLFLQNLNFWPGMTL